MNTPLKLAPMPCPREGCGRPLQVLSNGGTVYLRCSAESPKCGIILPVDTAVAWQTANERDEVALPLRRMDGGTT